MKRKLFFITFLMLFCSSMFGQHWTMTEADEALYNSNMTVTTVIEINGEEQRRTDLEIAAFCNNGLRGVGEIQYKESTDRYIATITILGGNVSGETINFKLFDPELDNGKELNTTFTVNFVTDEVIGKPSSPISINFNNTYWSIDISNLPITSMQYTSYIKIDGEEQRRTDLELAAFSGETLCGWVQPIYSSKADKFVAFLTIYGEEGDEITLKLYDPELEGGKVLTADSPFGFLNNNMVGNPTTPLEFRNNPIAQITNATGNHYFSTLEAAVAAAKDGETILLLQNVTLTETLTIEKSITIDLNEKKVTGADGDIVFNVKAATTIKNGTVIGNKSGTTSGLIDIYTNLDLDGVTIETSKINALSFKAGECTATLTNCNVTGAFKGYGGSVWEIKSGTYNAASTSINDQLNGTASISGGTFHYVIAEEECAPGYVVKKNGNDTWTVEYAPAAFVDADNDGELDEGEIVYGNLDQIFANHKEGDVHVVLTADIVANAKVDTDADAHYYFTTKVTEGVTMDFLFADDWNYIQKMTLGQKITLNAKYLLAWTEFNVSGTINTGYLYTTGAKTTITETGVVNANTGDKTVQVKNGAEFTVNGTLNTSTLNVWVGESKLVVSGANAKVNASWVDIWDGAPSVTVKNGATLATSEDNGIKASRGGSITVDNATLTGKIQLGHNGESAGELTVTGNSTLSPITLTVVGSTVEGPEGLNVTTNVPDHKVVYENGVYKVVAKVYVAQVGEVKYESVNEAINSADDGAIVQLLPGTIEEYVYPWPESNHSKEKSITILGSKDDEGNLTTTLTGGMYLGYDDSQCREHNIVVKDVNFTGKGILVACQKNVVIENNKFSNITDCVAAPGSANANAISVIGKNINATVTGNVIDGTASAGINLRDTKTVNVSGNTVTNTVHNSITVQNNTTAEGDIVEIKDNTLSNWGTGGEGRAVRIAGGATVSVNGNVMTKENAPEEFVKVTNATTVNASANYWNGVSPLTDGMFTGVEGDLVPVLLSYYTDVEKTNLVTLAPSVAKIGEKYYQSLSAAFADAAQTEELTTIELLPVTIEEDDDINTPEKTIKLPATIKNVIVKGADNNTSILKNLTIQNAQGGTYDMSNITFDGVVFDNSNIVLTGWRTGFESLKNLIVKNCIFSNIVRSPTNLAAVHINVAADKAVNGFTFINNVIDGVTGAQNSGIYGQFTGEVIVKDNVINNVAFRPYVIQLTTDDGIADEFTVTGNTFSGSAAGRAQGLGNNAEGTDEVELIVSNNIFKGITDAQQICYWNFNEATTTATLEKNYYDIDVVANPGKIYYNSAAGNISELSEMGIFPIYEELNDDGTINEESLFDPVAYVETKAFETLDEAVDEVTENNNTIVVIANVENINHLIIPAGKNVVLDLNGKTISGVCNTSSEHNADLIEVENTATLTIKDSSENEEGKVTYASGTYKTGFTVDVKGNLILESGTIELTDSWSLGFAVDVRPNAWGTAYTEASTFVMNGGKVVSSDTGVRIDSNSGETNPSSRHGVYFTMNGGDIISDWDAIFIQHRYANDLYVNIAENAGTIQGKNSPLRIYGDGVVSDVEINIAGGTFDYTGDEGTTGWVVEKFLKATEAQVEAAKIEITGGTFDADVSRFCAFNYVCTSNGDGTYGIEYKQQENNAFVISTLHELEAFRDAVNAGNDFEGQTVVLSAGVDLNPTRAINNWEPIGTQANPFKGTFDGGNNTISNLVVDGGSYVGLFGYANEATIKNVKIENANVKGTDCVGVIAGSVYSKSTIENCHISGLIQVEGLTKVGGIHGYGYAKIVNSSVVGANDSYVKGTYVGPDQEGDNVGGIVGHGGEGNTIADCTVNNISVIGTRKVGGIVGTTDRAKVLDNCLVDGVVIENTAGASYANDNAATTTIGGLIGNYHGEGKDGSVKNCVVKNVTFNVGNAKNVGPIVGGYRLRPNNEITDVTASGNLIYMSTISENTTNTYLMHAVAQIDENKYYTLFDAVKAAQGETTIITLISNTSEEFAINNTATAITLDLNGNELTGAILPSNAKLTVKNGTINNNNSNVSAIEINEGTLVLNDVKVTSKRHGVRIDGPVTATINGGEYGLSATSGTRHAVNVSGAANVTITDGIFVGPKGTTMDSGSAVCVQSGATVTIEDGDFSGGKTATLGVSGTMIVKGGTFDQDVTAYCAEGYVCQKNAENKYEVFFAVASITNANGTLYYASLQAAVNAAENGETVKVEANVEATVMPTADSTNNLDNCLVYVANDKTIIIDLNGKTITVNGSDEAIYDVLAIRNHGNLTITDSNATAGTIKLNYDGTQEFGSSQIHSTILNFGTLTIDKVNIVNNATKGYTSHAIFNYSWGGNAILTINGGVISSVNKGYSVYSQAYDDFSNNKCEVYINDGTLSDGLRYDNTGYHAANGANVVIIGGVFETNAENKPSLYIGGNGTTAVAISGGTFSEPVLEEYCAAGYIPQDNGNGTYGVKLGQYVAQVGDVKYESLQEAVAAVSATDNEIIILANSTESVSVLADVIINLNEIETEAYITAGGNLTFKGNGSIKTLKSIVGGTITVENGKTLALNNFSFGSSDNASATYTITGGTITANYGFFQHGVYALYSNFETGYMYYSYGSDITVYGRFHSEGEGDGLDYVRGKLTIADGGESIHDKALWVGQPASWGPMEATLIVKQGGYVKANSLSVYSGSALQIDATDLTGGETIDEVECNTLTVEGTVEAINNGKVMAVVEGNKIMIKAKPVMIVETDAYYATLAEAFAAANNQTVKVLQNITLTETVTIAADKTVTLDLNGKTISAEATFAVKAIVNNGTLTINGNGGTIDISASTTESIQVVDNYGTLTINGGTYKGASSNFSYAIRANHENSVTNIVGATITTYFGAVGINKGVTTITDGKFEVTGAAGGHALYVEGANVTINGGEFIPYPTTVYSYAVLTNDDNANVSITGGTFKKGLGDPCVKALSGNIIITGGTFATDVNAYCHEYYDAITEDNITWTVEQVLFAQTTELQAGWNWYSSYVDLSTPNGLEKIQTALGTNGEQIKTQGNQFSFYQNNQWISSPGFTSLYNDKMYMIKTTSDVSAEIIGSTIDYANTVIVLNKGWNWISYPLSVSTDVNEALEGMSPADGDIIKGYDDNSTSVYYLSDDPQTPSVWWPAITLEPGQGYMYMYKSNTNSSFIYTAGDGTSAKANSRDNNYWVSAKSQYANNMTMIAMLSVDNEIVKGDYEIAAFANGECRGSARPIYNEHLDAYVLLLTVYGDEVEELTFKYYDVNYETEYELSNRINYSNDAVVGSIDEPYMFNLDILNIGETSVENISIYPNPTTTGSEINLQAVCDKVEVFNALGVKVAEYTNVDSIDAIETAGVYVIRLTIDNSARNCRLIVK